jgi:hypothetical protein
MHFVFIITETDEDGLEVSVFTTEPKQIHCFEKESELRLISVHETEAEALAAQLEVATRLKASIARQELGASLDELDDEGPDEGLNIHIVWIRQLIASVDDDPDIDQYDIVTASNSFHETFIPGEEFSIAFASRDEAEADMFFEDGDTIVDSVYGQIEEDALTPHGFTWAAEGDA